MAAKSVTRICLLGSASAGKTCFIGGLAVLAEPDRKSAFHLSGRDTSSQTYLNSLATALHKQEWPASTTQTRLLELDVRYQEALLHLSLLDYRGEEFHHAFHNLDQTRLGPLWTHLEGVDVVLLMLDPDVDLERGEALNEQEQELRRERLSALLNALMYLCNAQIQEGKRTAAPEVAVLLSKRDRHPELNDGVAPRRYLKRRAPELLQRLDDWSPRVGVCAVSAVGPVVPDPRHPEGDPVPAKTLCPTGYPEVFEWVLWRKGAAARRKLVRVAGCVVAVAALLLGGWWTQVAWKQSRLQDNAQAALLAEIDGGVWFPTDGYRGRLDTLVNAELARLKRRLGASPGILELNEVGAAAADLARCKNSTHHEEAQSLLADVQKARRETMFAAVKSAYSQQHAGFADAASVFLRDFPQGTQADQVRAMLESTRTQEKLHERNLIREIRPGEFRFLAKKADAIASYLAKFARDDAAYSEEMKRAEKLARKLADSATYTVHLRGCGVFSKSRDHAIRVLHDGAEVTVYEPGKASSSSWGPEDAAFQMNWQPGDQIRVELWDYEWGNEVAASETEKGPLSLEILCGRRTLRYNSGWDSSDFREGPFVKFELDGFVDDDWRVLKDWVYPGDKW